MDQELLTQVYHIRQADLAPVTALRSRPVSIIGAGGIGSSFVLLAAKLGLDIREVWDGDTVAPENIGGQLPGPRHIDQPKVGVLKEICADLTGIDLSVRNAFVKGGEPFGGIVVETVDSMRTRRMIWERTIMPSAPMVDTLVSVRMGAESGTILTVDPSVAADAIWYEVEGLYSDEEAIPLPCTGRATVYCGTIAASLALYQVKRILMRQQPVARRIDFDLDSLLFIVDD